MPQYDEGKTVVLICHQCKVPRSDLASPSYCKSILEALTRRIEMTPLKEPEAVTLTHPLDSTKSGVSAYQFIAESHIAVHTWPEVKGARVTIDSCKDFDASEAVDLIRKMLKPQKVDIRQALWVNTVHVEEKSAKVGIVEKGLAILKSLIG